MMRFLFVLFLFTLGYTQSRGLWVTRYTLSSSKNISDLKRFSVENEITDVFIQLRGRSDAYYYSEVEKNHKFEHNNNEQLKELFAFFKANKINTHIWLNVFLMASSLEATVLKKNHVLNRNKNWVDASSDFKKLSQTIEETDDLKDNPELEGIYVLPCFPDLQKYYNDIVREIITLFKPDGIHFDYFRLAGKDYGFHPRMRMKFNKETKLNAEYLMRDNSNLDLKTYQEIESTWIDFLNKQFTDFLSSMTKIDRKTKWSVAVKPDFLKAKNNYAQDWQYWINHDIVDFVVPMNYVRNEDLFSSRLNQYLETKNSKKIWIGVSSYNQSLDELTSKIKKVNDVNLNLSIFSFNDLQKKEIKFVFKK
jgi:uncharacterized lipoprotein YddW (UPF0748 family)